MDKLQQTEFDLLKCFVDICSKLNLSYYLVCGSALGAVKYKGFIPWDDDIDIGMPREDYNILLEKAPKLLPEKYFLQNSNSDLYFPMIYSKLRNSETAYIEESSAKLPINHGIYIDIFPLDGYPKGRTEQALFEIKKKLYSFELSVAFDFKRAWHVKLLTKLLRLLGYHKRTQKTAEKYTTLISKYSVFDSQYICNHGNWQGRLEYAAKYQYGKGAIAEFEGLKITVPENYDEYLSQKYGNWKADLPKEQQIGHHYFKICDTKKSYTEYVL